MTDTPRGVLERTTDTVVSAISFDKILVFGLLTALIIILLLSALLSYQFGSLNKDIVAFTNSFYKDTALILVGALANSVRHKKEAPIGDTE